MKYQEFGLEKNTFEKIFQNNLKKANEYNSQSKPSDLPYFFWYDQKFLFNDLVCIGAYLQDDLDMVKFYSNDLLNACDLLFWGEWRNLPNEYAQNADLLPQEYALRKTPWMQPFLHCTALSLALGDISKAQRIASYPTEECEDLELGAKREDRYLYLLLAQWIATGTWNHKYEKIIVDGKKKSPRMVLHVLMNLRDDNRIMFEKTLQQYLSHFKKYDFSNCHFNKILSYIGTILFYLGIQKGYSITDSRILNNPHLILDLQ